MKLAEALILRADKKKRLDQVRQRLLRNAKVQEGDQPAEAPEALLAEAEQLSQELVALIQRINRTNMAIELEPGVSLSDALAQREGLALRHGLYRDLAQAATVTQDLRTKSEVKFKSTVKVADLQAAADQFAQAHRELDTRVQELNWRVELHA